MFYSLFVYGSPSSWLLVRQGSMSKPAAAGLFNQLKARYSVRAFRGREAGRLVAARYLPSDRPSLEAENFPQNVRDFDKLNK